MLRHIDILPSQLVRVEASEYPNKKGGVGKKRRRDGKEAGGGRANSGRREREVRIGKERGESGAENGMMNGGTVGYIRRRVVKDW